MQARPSTSGYARDASYRWLRGKLEYSEVRRQWKLRYIALSDRSDDYGGSVVLSDARMLRDYQPGDAVEVCGRISDQPVGDGFSPQYSISSIKRIVGL